LSIFFTSLWPGLAAWSLLYVSDYALTIVCARLYRSGVNEIISFEGSFEITPYFQRDIDSLKLISPRFIRLLCLTSILLTMFWFVSADLGRNYYAFVLGAFVLLEFAVHTRHLRNFFAFRAMSRPGGVRGHLGYSRPFILQRSSEELFIFAGLLLALCAFAPSWFFVGGAVSCASTGVKHHRLSRQAPAQMPAAVQPESSS